MLDAHADEALCDGNRVFWHELLEGNEEAGLDGNAAGDGGVTAAVSGVGERGGMYVQGRAAAGQEIAGNVDEEAQEVGDHGDEQDELGELVRAPGALQVAAAIEDGEAGDEQAEHVLLDDGGQREDPRIDDGLAGDDGQVGHAIAHAEQRLLDLLDPAGVRAQGEVEQGEGDDGGEQGARQRRQVEAGHGRGTAGAHSRRRGEALRGQAHGGLAALGCSNLGARSQAGLSLASSGTETAIAHPPSTPLAHCTPAAPSLAPAAPARPRLLRRAPGRPTMRHGDDSVEQHRQLRRSVPFPTILDDASS